MADENELPEEATDYPRLWCYTHAGAPTYIKISESFLRRAEALQRLREEAPELDGVEITLAEIDITGMGRPIEPVGKVRLQATNAPIPKQTPLQAVAITPSEIRKLLAPLLGVTVNMPIR